MRLKGPQDVRGRIAYLVCLQDYCGQVMPKDAAPAAKTALAVLAELGKIRLTDAEAAEISVFRSYFSVFQDGS